MCICIFNFSVFCITALALSFITDFFPLETASAVRQNQEISINDTLFETKLYRMILI